MTSDAVPCFYLSSAVLHSSYCADVDVQTFTYSPPEPCERDHLGQRIAVRSMSADSVDMIRL
eukprot:m.808296 g.808296  ORF g.808296 m.808296 type:complete len:62 (-) comp23381_c1_seq26:2911-3096(-)